MSVGTSFLGRLSVRGFVSLVVGTLLAGAAVAQTKPAASAPLRTAAEPLLRGAFVATMDQEYSKMDANKDGAVTKAELEANEERRASAAVVARARALFSRFDTDRNGQLSADEFIRASVGRPKKQDATSVMARLDTDRDSKVTIVEYRALTLAAFDRLDLDKNSVLSDAEQRAGGFIR